MKPSSIVNISAREVYSDRMKSAVMAVVTTQSGTVGKALISSGLSVGSHESPFVFDNDYRFSGFGMQKAAFNIENIIGPKLIGMDVLCQRACDNVILSCDKNKLGANATAAISTAILNTGANELGIPLYEHLGGVRAITLPVPAALAASGSNRYSNDVACGYKPTYCFVAYDYSTYTEASNALWEVYMNWSDLMEDSMEIKMQPIAGMAIPKGKLSDDYALWDLLAKAIEKAGCSGKVGLQVDISANSFYDKKTQFYRGLFSSDDKDRSQMIDLVCRMAKDYPFVIIEDPLHDDDFEGFAEITRRTDIQITADDLVATNMDRLKKAISMKAGNAIRLVTSQVGTVSEMIDVAQFAQEHKFGIVPCGERGEGLNACDYAVALNAGSAHEYGMCYSGNKLLQIEKELGHRARFFGSVGIKGSRFQLGNDK